MEISVFVVTPDGKLTDDMVTGPEAKYFFAWEDVESILKAMGPNAVAFRAVTNGWFTNLPQPVDWVAARTKN